MKPKINRISGGALVKLLASVLALAFVAAACGSDEAASNTATSECGTGDSFTEASEPVTDLTVAIVAPSASEDLAFTQS
ncbi:MAG: hypothetical protein ACRBK7_11795, partial [Acidimicrobiales bacterium]